MYCGTHCGSCGLGASKVRVLEVPGGRGDLAAPCVATDVL